jgi:FkbM family methyltransferase
MLYGAGSFPLLRGAVPAEYRREIDARAASQAFRLREGIEFRIHPRAARAFQCFVDREPDVVREMDGFLAATRSCSTLLDVGALYGVFSMAFAASRRGVAVAIEPSASAFATLHYHAQANPDLDIRPIRIALGESDGQIAMRYDWEHLVVGRGSGWLGVTEQVPTQTIDRLTSELGLRFDAIKIDVEGFEAKVLTGAEGTLREAGPTLFLEVHPTFLPTYGASAEEVVDLLEGIGYRFFRSDLSPIPIARDHFLPIDEHEARRGYVRRVICRR